MSEDDIDALFELSPSSSGSEDDDRDIDIKLDSDSNTRRASKRKRRLHQLTAPTKRRRHAKSDGFGEDSVAETICLTSADDEHGKDTNIAAQDPRPNAKGQTHQVVSRTFGNGNVP
ncbi:hypothetical protein GN958_ATG22757 [Phytophthora infestans]|uniref:Uncharacterized protein n=1 Tax=Phytophthora infestans TaxID=4787 RepID=A0A8S9TMI7_PHYIN|nr:hypothetical protein GN958_ATG22757 [Phytophthora infestans]